MKMRFRFTRFAFAFCFMIAIGLRADDAHDLFNAANKSFEQGRYAEAISGYDKLIRSGKVSPAAYFNLGNAYLKSDQLGRAIAAYLNAQELSPRDPDVRANLQYAREQAGGGKIPSPRWQSWIKRLTLNEWTVMTSVVLSAWFFLLAARQLRIHWRESFRGTLWGVGVVCVFLVVCTATAVHAKYFLKSSVVIVPEAVVRLGPLEESQSAFTLRDGAEVAVVEKSGEWLRIADASERTGWIPQRQLQSIDGEK